MLVDAFASQPHYFDHLAPIWRALPQRGRFLVPRQIERAAARHEIAVERGDWQQAQTGPPVLIAGMGDAARVHPNRRLVLVEHGAGQTYAGDRSALTRHPHYAGGVGRDRVALFVVPSERVAALNRARYPRTPNAVVGCARLDNVARRTRRRSDPPTVVVTFHYQGPRDPPEARTAFPAFRKEFVDLEGGPWRLLGHEHPRWGGRLLRIWEARGWESTADADEVLARADLLVGDNSSLLYEAAAVGVPVLCLDAPWYRREVEHGLRFWQHAPGLRVGPGDLVDGVRRALDDPPELQAIRHSAVAAVYSRVDGRAGQRAARAIVRHRAPEEEWQRLSCSQAG